MRRFMRLEFSASLCEAGATFGPCQWDMMVRHMHPQTGPRDGSQVTGVTGVNIFINGKYLIILLKTSSLDPLKTPISLYNRFARHLKFDDHFKHNTLFFVAPFGQFYTQLSP